MKKTLIALAALASTAAFAQNVTISGTMDAGLEKASSAASMGVTGSRSGTTGINFAGTEDLGGGLKAEFFIGTSFDPSYSGAASKASYSVTGVDAGAAAGAANAIASTTAAGTQSAGTGTIIGNNNMYVGVAGGFGSLRIGRTLDPVFTYTQTANSTKGVSAYNSRAGVVDGNGVYLANQVLYTSPNISGLTVQVSYALSEFAGRDADVGAAIAYAAGPVSIALSYSEVNSASSTNSASGMTAAQINGNSIMALSGSYNFGPAKLFATYTDRDIAGDSTSYNVGISAPLGAVTVWADYSNNSIRDVKSTQVGLKYALSKRSTAYFNYGNKDAAGASTNGYGFGLQHNF